MSIKFNSKIPSAIVFYDNNGTRRNIGKIMRNGMVIWSSVKPDENPDEISLDTLVLATMTTASDRGIQSIITPSTDITFTTMTLYSTRMQTGASADGANAKRTAICYIGEVPTVAPGSTHTSLLNPEHAVIFNNDMKDYDSSGTQGWCAPTNGKRIYGVPIADLIAGQTVYKYTSKLASGETITLKKGHHYLIGLSAYPYMPTEKFVAISYTDNEWLGYVNIDLQNSAWGAGTDVTSDFVDIYPYIEFDGVPFKYFAQHEIQLPPSSYTFDVSTRTAMTAIDESSIINKSGYDKFILIMRHSEREDVNADSDSDGETGELTANGYVYAEEAGKLLQNKFTEDECVFFGTNKQRTQQTAQYFKKGMFNMSEAPDISTIIDGSAYFKKSFTSSTTWPAVATYANNSANDAAISAVAKSIIEDTLAAMGEKNFALCVSHDFNTLPLVTWGSNYGIQFNFTDGNNNAPWLCYMAGIACRIKGTIISIKPIYSIKKKYDTNNTLREMQSGQSGYQGVMSQGYDNIMRANDFSA